MKKQVLSKIVLILCGLLAVTPLCAQKRLLPVLRNLKTDGVKSTLPAVQGGAAVSLSVHNSINKTLQQSEDLLPLYQADDNLTAEVENIFSKTDDMSDLLSQLLERYYVAQVNEKWETENQKLVSEIRKLWLLNNQFLNNDLFKSVFKPIEWPSPFAVQNNKILLRASQKFFEKMQWLESLPNQGRGYLSLDASHNTIGEFAQQLSGERLIMIGEQHGIPQVQQTIARLVLFLKKQQPKRRVVLFTEFIDLKGKNPKIENSLDTYYLRTVDMQLDKLQADDFGLGKRVDYAETLFAQLFKNNVEIYPLEDRNLMEVIADEKGPLCQVKNPALAISLRNKTWARIVESKMAEIRKTDPDALFVVYAGIGHTSWLMPYSLPKFFAHEKPAVLEVTLGKPSSVSALYTVWGEHDLFFRNHTELSLYYWKGGARSLLGRKTGFNYALVVPEK